MAQLLTPSTPGVFSESQRAAMAASPEWYDPATETKWSNIWDQTKSVFGKIWDTAGPAAVEVGANYLNTAIADKYYSDKPLDQNALVNKAPLYFLPPQQQKTWTMGNTVPLRSAYNGISARGFGVRAQPAGGAIDPMILLVVIGAIMFMSK